jgi:hypothetical protein
LQKSLPAEADGAVHMTAAATVAAAPTVPINTLVFMLGFLFAGRRRHSAAAGYSGDSICSSAPALEHLEHLAGLQARRIVRKEPAYIALCCGGVLRIVSP